MSRFTQARLLLMGFFAVCLLVVSAPVAWAVQSHGGSEGLVAHQLGHILFACGLVVVFVIGQKGRWSGKEWSSFRWFLFLAGAWCALTFTGHFLDQWVAPDRFVRSGGQVVRFKAVSGWDWVYYLSRLDHLLWFPALVALWRALVHWERRPEGPS